MEELKIKYQYSYFIYPYIIEEKLYKKYMNQLLCNSKCKIKFWEKQKDYNLYSFFLPKVKQDIFSNFEYNKDKIKQFFQFSKDMQAQILAKQPCTIFTYDTGNTMQGKVDKEDGIFFKIEEIQIICFYTGICFLAIKTELEGSNSFNDILDFNYKFRDFNSDYITFRGYENIKIQTNNFENMKMLSDIIYEIIGKQESAKQYDIDMNRFLTYSYVCVDSEYWNENNSLDSIKNEFLKYAMILPSTNTEDLQEDGLTVFSSRPYTVQAFTKQATMILTSGIESYNYSKLPYEYENEYLYTYILVYYQKIYLKKLEKEFKNTKKISKVQKMFFKFSKELWYDEITSQNIGSTIYQKLVEVLEIKDSYNVVKEKYDIYYKQLKIEKDKKINIIMLIAIIISLSINIINFIV